MSPIPTIRRSRYGIGFTLAELMIALGIFGVIAAFSIPKILGAAHGQDYNAEAREAFATISQAYLVYMAQEGVTVDTNGADIFPYMNNVQTVSTLVDDNPGWSSIDCSDTANYACVKLHNGGVLWADKNSQFDGTTDLHAVYINFDPDGVYGGSTSGPSKALEMMLYYDGTVTSSSHMKPGTILYGGPAGTVPDPEWFHWE
ncbi:MAG: type II secretion system protein [Candidatus Melainabacteria bacterium]